MRKEVKGKRKKHNSEEYFKQTTLIQYKTTTYKNTENMTKWTERYLAIREIETERERDKERETERETERDTERETDRETDRRM